MISELSCYICQTYIGESLQYVPRDHLVLVQVPIRWEGITDTLFPTSRRSVPTGSEVYSLSNLEEDFRCHTGRHHHPSGKYSLTPY